MELTLKILMNIKKRYDLTNEEFLSMVRSNEYNPFVDKEAMKLIYCVVAVNVIWNVISSILMDYKPNKKKKK